MLARHFYALMATTRIFGDSGPSGNMLYDEQFDQTVKSAWGLRKLISTYFGPIIRVRDTSTNTEYDLPADVDGALDTSSLPAGTFACTTIYEQTGSGANMVQTTSSMQPILTLNSTLIGGPSLAFDGVDDYMRDVTAGTTRPYMVSNPIYMYLGGARSPREQFARPWNVPHQDGANASPYMRCGVEINNTHTSMTDQFNVRSNGNSYGPFSLVGMNNINGWQGHVLAAGMGRILQPGWPAITMTTNTVTYPNSTRMYLNANGLGTENNGAKFVEFVVMDGTGAVQADIQTALDDFTYTILYGPNTFYKIVLNHMFNDQTIDGGFAEIELRASAGGADLTYSNMPAMANRQFNTTTESWKNTTDNNNSSYWSSGTGTGNPVISYLINESAEVAEVKMKLRGDSPYFAYSPDQWTLYRFIGKDGWQAAQQINMTADGNSAGQEYVKTINWITSLASVTKIPKYILLHRNGPSVSKLGKYTVVQRVAPSVSKLSRFIIMQAI